MVSTLKALEARRITRTNYFREFQRVAGEILRASPFRGDHHFLNGPSELRAAAMLTINRDPGDISRFDPNPKLGHYDQSAFVQRIATPNGEFLKMSESDKPAPFPQSFVQKTIDRVLNGEVMWEHMVGGKATRLKIGKEKFILEPDDILKQLTEDDPEAAARVACRPKDLSLGARHMLAFVYGLKKLATERGVDWKTALFKQTVFIIANEKVIEETIDIFRTFAFFGLGSDKVFFKFTNDYNALGYFTADNYQPQRPPNDPLILSPEGELASKAVPDFTHNHGVARMETTDDNCWFTRSGSSRKFHTSEQIARVYSQHANLQSLNIEDLSYLLGAIDPYALTLALYSKDIVGEDYFMDQEVVGQKVPAQKGGVFGYDPDFFATGKGRLVMKESFTAFARFHHYMDEVARKLWASIKWLNLNQNNYPNPIKLFRMIKQSGLPVWLEAKPIGGGAFGFRNESPQGDANFFLPTLYVARSQMASDDLAPQPIGINNLKVPEDCPNGLSAMERQDALPGFDQLVRELHYQAMSLEDLSFAHLTRFFFKKDPLDIGTLITNPFFRRKLVEFEGGRFHKTLMDLQQVFRVEGSLVYQARISGDKVFLKVVPNSRRGTAAQYPSRAEGTEVEAQDIKSRVFKENRVWTDFKPEGQFSYILASNRSPDTGEGELVLLLGTYNEDVPFEVKQRVLAKKLENLLAHARTTGVDEIHIRGIENAFWTFPMKFLFENCVSVILKEIVAGNTLS